MAYKSSQAGGADSWVNSVGWQLVRKGLNTHICRHDLWISIARI